MDISDVVRLLQTSSKQFFSYFFKKSLSLKMVYSKVSIGPKKSFLCPATEVNTVLNNTTRRLCREN